jgi:flagellar motility protein MotE (MotC chaperone)
MSSKGPEARLVKVGSHLFACLSARDFMELGETRWHALFNRTQEMLEHARAEPAQRVEAMKEIYALRDRTSQLAIQHAATLEGAYETIELAAKKAKVDLGDTIDRMKPDDAIRCAIELVGVDLSGTDSGNE